MYSKYFCNIVQKVVSKFFCSSHILEYFETKILKQIIYVFYIFLFLFLLYNLLEYNNLLLIRNF